MLIMANLARRVQTKIGFYINYLGVGIGGELLRLFVMGTGP
jgi:hypothetical protein